MNNPKTKVGTALIELIRRKQDERRIVIPELADLLGMSKPYLNALFSGERPVNKLGPAYLDAIAAFLSIPKAQVYNLAEILVPEDYVHQESIDDNLKEVYQRLSNDITLLHLVPRKTEWNKLDMKTKLLIAYMYESLSHQKFITGIKAYKFEDPAPDSEGNEPTPTPT